MFKDAGISINVSFVRLFDGFGELFLVPLRIFGGVNVKVPSLGEVLKPCRVHDRDSGLFIRQSRRR